MALEGSVADGGVVEEFRPGSCGASRSAKVFCMSHFGFEWKHAEKA